MRVALTMITAAVVVLLTAGMSSQSNLTNAQVIKPTYAEHVAPILNRNCVACHRAGEVAPFSLSGYQNAKKWAGPVATATKTKQMPPWKAVHGYGQFIGEPRLSKEEIELLSQWSEQGAPRGNPSKEPKLPTYPSGPWSLGKPDLIVSAKQPFRLSPEGADVYRNFVIDLKNEKPLFIKAIDVHPGNKKVVHHVIAFLDRRGSGHKLEEKSKDGQEGYSSAGGGVGFLPDGALGGWAPGLRPVLAKPGVAYRVEPNTTLILQVHYHKSGKSEQDLTQVGLYFAKEAVEKELDLAWIFNFALNIPAGDSQYSISKVSPVNTDIDIHSVMPHMHLLGRRMEAKVVKPDGTEIPLIKIQDWDFNWQLQYTFKTPIRVPKGSRVVVDAEYDNSEKNPRNPNTPPKRVRWGEETTDEMFLLVMGYTKA